MKTNSRTLLSKVLLLALIAVSIDPDLARSQSSQQKTGSGDLTDVNKAPISLSYLLKMLSDPDYTKSTIMKMIKARGLSFERSPENVGKVRDATKDKQLFQFAQEAMQPWKRTPSPPARPPTGSILAICEPAECEITLNGSTVPSEDGQKSFSELNPGPLTVKFSESGYEPQIKTTQVKAGEQTAVRATLELTNLGKAKRWRDEMWKALAAGERGEEAQEIAATGSATIFEASGKETNWVINIKFAATTSSMELRLPSGNTTVFVLECRGEEDCKQQSLPKKRFGSSKSAIDADVATVALRDFRKNHLGSILKKLSSSEVRIVSTSDDATGDHVLHFEDSEVGYEVRLLPNFLIAQVTLRSKLGLGDVTLITYSEYAPLRKSGAQYPKKTAFKSGEKRGFKAELTWGK